MLCPNNKKSGYFKTISKLLGESGYTLSPKELAERLSKEEIQDETKIFKTRSIVLRIFKNAIKNGLVCTKEVVDTISAYQSYDYEELYSKLSKVCEILESNAIYRSSAPVTKNGIRRRVIRHAFLHKIKVTESAALFSAREDCGLVIRKKRVIFPISALFLSALFGLILKSPLSVVISFIPMLIILSGLSELISHESVPSSNIEELPKTLILTSFDKTKVDGIYRYFERLITLSDDNNLVFGAVLELPDSRSMTCPSDSVLIEKFRDAHEKLRKKYSDRFSFFIPKRQYIPGRRCFSGVGDKYAVIKGITDQDMSFFDVIYGSEDCKDAAYTLFLPYECEPSASCIKQLIKTMSHKLNRPIILNDKLEGGRGMISGKVRAYIQKNRSPFSRISLHGNYPSPVIFDNVAFKLLIRRGMDEEEIKHSLKWGKADYALSYVKASPCSLGESIPIFRGLSFNCQRELTQKRLINALKFISPLISFLLIVFSFAFDRPYFCLGLAIALAVLPYIGIIKDTCLDIAKGRYNKAPSDLADFILAFLYALALIPFLFFEGICNVVNAFITRGKGKSGGDSARHFFALTLADLGCGIIFLSLDLHPYLAFIWLFSPLYIIYLGSVRKSRHVSKPQKLLERHINGAHDYIAGRAGVSPLLSAEGEKTITPTEIGLYLTSLLAFCDLGKERLSSCYPLLSDALSFIERLSTSYGLYYDRYLIKDLSPIGTKTVNAKENGMLLTCLICLHEGLRESLPEEDILIERCEKLIERAEITRVCERMSEFSSLPAAFLSSAAKKRDFMPLDTSKDLLSESGSAESYMLPFLFLPLFPSTLFSRKVNKVFEKNISFSRKKLWGVTSCRTGRLDNDMNYIFSENGITKLSYTEIERKAVFSPYAAFLFLPHFRIPSMALLLSFGKEKALGGYGFYEAVDFTCSEKTVVRCYETSHLCMSAVAAANYLCGNVFVRRFCKSKYVNPYLYLLRGDSRRPFAKFKVSELIPKIGEAKTPLRESAVPGLCLIGNTSLSFYASSAGHLMFLSGGKAFTENCFKEYDMKNKSGSVSLTFTTEKISFNAFEGDFSYNNECALYLSNHSDIVSNTKIIINKGLAVCEIRMTVKGAFNKISACLEITPSGELIEKEGHFTGETEDMSMICTSGKGAVLSREGTLCKISTAEECPDGVFRCSFFVSLAENEKKAIAQIKPLEISEKTFQSGMEKEAILASVLFKAGKVRSGSAVSPLKLKELKEKNIICALCPEDLRNISMLGALSRASAELSDSGLDTFLAVFCRSEETKEKVRPLLSQNDVICDYEEEYFTAARIFSAMFINDEDFLSPESFFSGIMNEVREVEPCHVFRSATPSREAPPYSHKTSNGYITHSKAVFYREALKEEIDFCIGQKMKIKLSSSGLSALYLDGHPLTSFLRLCVTVKDKKYDLISSCRTIEKSDGLVSFEGRIEDTDIRCEIFIDDEMSLLVIRVCGNGVQAFLDLVPYSPASDPRLCTTVAEGNSKLYRSLCRGFYSENTLFVSKPCAAFDKQTLIVGMYNSSPEVFYMANDKYSCPSGCEGPVAENRGIEIYSPLKECDHLVCHRIPEFFNGICLDAGKRIYGFPVLSLTDESLFKETIIEYASSRDSGGKSDIILAAAIAQYFKISRDGEFLKIRVPYADGNASESIYMHGIRAIENYVADSNISKLVKYLVCRMYEPLCRQMNDSLPLPELDREALLSIDHPLLDICHLLFEGSVNKAVSKLASLCPGYGESDPTFLSIFYMLYLRFVIGLEDHGDYFTIDPMLCASFPSFKMSYTKGRSKFIITAKVSDKNEICLDKVPYEGDFYFDNSLHTIDISAVKRS